MATTVRERTETQWRIEGRTTIELRRSDAGEWLATQRGVDAEGRGDSAAAAAAAYCQEINAVD